jgi:hypothetical protein
LPADLTLRMTLWHDPRGWLSQAPTIATLKTRLIANHEQACATSVAHNICSASARYLAADGPAGVTPPLLPNLSVNRRSAAPLPYKVGWNPNGAETALELATRMHFHMQLPFFRGVLMLIPLDQTCSLWSGWQVGCARASTNTIRRATFVMRISPSGLHGLGVILCSKGELSKCIRCVFLWPTIWNRGETTSLPRSGKNHHSKSSARW